MYWILTTNQIHDLQIFSSIWGVVFYMKIHMKMCIYTFGLMHEIFKFSWSSICLIFFFFSVTALFYLEYSRRIQDSKRREWRSAWGGRKRERKREREREHARVHAHACTQDRESERKHFGSSFYMAFPPPGPALCKLGLARSAVCSVCSAWSLHSGPRTFLVF